MKKLTKIELAEDATIMSEKEMKDLKGGFDCGSGQNYYTGSCTDGTGFSICASSYGEAFSIGSGFCTGN
ncbi:TIGR04149 family rSAM-modified RiPP [Dysgonomonas sp. ZJ279]|uniref:TIGR04149 family rSAM-modified RiPP n=1 Tax=Dysgonomonas sp. ZJ279 TaxID=2709796 RepID=UPI0013EADA1A|nr:TIGR04149 family rSAM-modified RiPP [Dysgonomonas sp. ZJ279]